MEEEEEEEEKGFLGNENVNSSVCVNKGERMERKLKETIDPSFVSLSRFLALSSSVCVSQSQSRAG